MSRKTDAGASLPLFDFHVHTKHSDGQGSVADVSRLAAERGITIAVTDHDTVEGAAAAREYMNSGLAAEVGAIVVCGVELSSYIMRDGEFDPVHILGLNISHDASLERLCGRLNQARLRELEKRVAYAASKGYALAPEVEKRVLEEAWFGKGDIAGALVDEGRFPGKDTAYITLWRDYDDTGILLENAPAAEAIECIHNANGLAIVAHPLRDEAARSFVDLPTAAERIRILAGMGLDGVEAFYSQFIYEECKVLQQMAAENGLLTSMGSDHHDFGRRNRLGRCCADEGVDMHDIAARITVPDALGLR